MLDLDCPWCEHRLELDDAVLEATCDACRVRVEIAPDPVVTVGQDALAA